MTSYLAKKTKKAVLYCGDMLDVIKLFPDKHFDLIFADPPYFLSNGGITCASGKIVSVNKAEWDISKGFNNNLEFTKQWISACSRVLKDNGTLWISGTYHNIYLCGCTLLEQNWHIINDIIWFKSNASPNLSCRMFTASHETIIWAKKTKSAKHYFNYDLMKNGNWEYDFLKKHNKQMRSVWCISSPRNNEKKFGKHPTQKPFQLLDRIIKASCPTEGLILDPFCGSGTTGVAAINNGMNFVAIDKDISYITKIAIPRIIQSEKEIYHGKDSSCKTVEDFRR